MGRLEKQIMIGALALVGVLVAVVILKGLAPRDEDPGLEDGSGGEWAGGTPALMLGPDGQPVVQVPEAMSDDGSEPIVVDLSDPVLPGADPLVQDPLADAGATPALESGAVLPLTEPVAPLTAPLVSDKLTYQVKKGDTLGHIAQRELGSVKYTADILRLNPDLNPNNLKLGQEIKLPARSELAPLPAGAAAAPVVAGETTHVVAAGDTLWGLAERFLGNGTRSGEIVAANPDKLKNRDAMLVIGMKLRIPKR
jgi:LysM repeat protein